MVRFQSKASTTLAWFVLSPPIQISTLELSGTVRFLMLFEHRGSAGAVRRPQGKDGFEVPPDVTVRIHFQTINVLSIPFRMTVVEGSRNAGMPSNFKSSHVGPMMIFDVTRSEPGAVSSSLTNLDSGTRRPR